MKFIHEIWTESTGGNCMADVVRLWAGALLVISDEAICLYDNPKDWSGEGDSANYRPLFEGGVQRCEPPGALTFVKGRSAFEEEGPVSVDLLELADGRVLGIDEESVVLYPGMLDFEDATPVGLPYLLRLSEKEARS